MRRYDVVTGHVTDGVLQAVTRPVYRYDYGITLQIEGNTEKAYEVEFCKNGVCTSPVDVVDNEILIPDELLRDDGYINVYLVVREDGARMTVASIVIPVIDRPDAE